jgi:pyrimidine deaminase RibD-like protein
MHQYLKFAIKQAQNHEYDHNLEYKLCAVIVRGGNVISIGFNQRKTNAFVEHYTDKIRGGGRNYCLSTHAEMHAVALARASTDLRGCKIFVARIRPAESPTGSSTGLSRPCPICINVLNAYGIKKAYYTIDDLNYGVMKIVEHEITDKVISKYNKEQM